MSISGAVTWVGRSSIEIQLHVAQPPTAEESAGDSVVLSATFIFAARDYKTQKSAPVNRLSPETEGEKSAYEAGEARNQLRKSSRVKGESKEIESRVEALLSEG